MKERKKLLVCNFSGGRTSAFLAKYIKESSYYNDKYDVIYCFANTGKEREETLEFIKDCENAWQLNTVWLEAVVNPEKGKGTRHKIVDFESASRNGEPFEAVIKKYSLPNMSFSHCTRELKMYVIYSYARSLGYKKNEIYNAIGIRNDEKHRVRGDWDKVYPLVNDMQVDEPFIRRWWDSQEFDLNLNDYEGNCDLCFKKSMRKRMTLLKENPNIGSWWALMEEKYGNERAPYFDLREVVSIGDIKKRSKEKFATIHDKHEISEQQASMDFEKSCFCNNI